MAETAPTSPDTTSPDTTSPHATSTDTIDTDTTGAGPTPGAEDAKLATLARATRARTQAPAGAAVRDLDGRTYAAADVALASLTIGALELAVAMAVSSGARGLEAALVVADALPDVAPVRDLAGADVPVFLADASGSVVGGTTT